MKTQKSFNANHTIIMGPEERLEITPREGYSLEYTCRVSGQPGKGKIEKIQIIVVSKK